MSESLDDLWTSDSAASAAIAAGTTPDAPGRPTVPDAPAEPQDSAAEEDAATATAPVEPVAETPQEPKKGNPRKDPRARVEQATAQAAQAREEARRERDERERLAARAQQLEAELAALKTPKAEPAPAAKPAGDTFPKFAQWIEEHPEQDFDSYLEARDEFRERKLTSSWQAQREADVAEARYHAALRSGASKYEDFAQVVSSNPPVSSVMAAAIKGSEQAADIVYWLGSHPDQCFQLAQESVNDASPDAARWMRKFLEAQVSASAAAPVPDSAPQARPSSALPPVNRVGGTASATPADPDDLPFGPDYIRAENAREKAKAGRRW